MNTVEHGQLIYNILILVFDLIWHKHYIIIITIIHIAFLSYLPYLSGFFFSIFYFPIFQALLYIYNINITICTYAHNPN